MKELREAPAPAAVTARRTETGAGTASGQLALWQLNLLRVGYAVMGVALAVLKWPLLFDHGPWSLAEGTKESMLIAMSFLALMGLRYPARMLPILLFEVAWKATWLGLVALPLWWDDRLEGAPREQTGAVLWVVLIVAVIPWRHAVTQYLRAPGDPWRRRAVNARRRPAAWSR
jgi:hypothetical protein